jgi:hypothetical protein
MRLTVYIMLLFSLSLVFYFLGYTNPLTQLMNNQGCTQAQIDAAAAAGTSLNCAINIEGFLRTLASNMTSDSGLASLLAIGIIGAAALLSGFGAIYIVPLMMLLAFLNLLLILVLVIFL